jgi:hypothetical protein
MGIHSLALAVSSLKTMSKFKSVVSQSGFFAVKPIVMDALLSAQGKGGICASQMPPV